MFFDSAGNRIVVNECWAEGRRGSKTSAFHRLGKTRPSQRIDEFDVFLHYESAAAIVRTLNRSKTLQTVLTTHNTSLMNNALTRPDCCYVMSYEGGVAGRSAPIRARDPPHARSVHIPVPSGRLLRKQGRRIRPDRGTEGRLMDPFSKCGVFSIFDLGEGYLRLRGAFRVIESSHQP